MTQTFYGYTLEQIQEMETIYNVVAPIYDTKAFQEVLLRAEKEKLLDGKAEATRRLTEINNEIYGMGLIP